METNVTSPPIFTVRRIKHLSFFIDESDLQPEALFRVDVGHNFKSNNSSNIISLEIEVNFILDNKEDQSKNRKVLSCLVQNVFEISNLSDFIEGENDIRLPNETIITLVSLSVSHTRAIMASLTAGTFFQENILPIINPVDLARSFFPEST